MAENKRKIDKVVDERGYAFMYQNDDELEMILVALVEKGVKWRTSHELKVEDVFDHEGLHHPEGYVMLAYEENGSEVAQMPKFMQDMIFADDIYPFDGVCASCGSDPQMEKDVPVERTFDSLTAVEWIEQNL